jgi:hypothetical protein
MRTALALGLLLAAAPASIEANTDVKEVAGSVKGAATHESPGNSGVDPVSYKL